MNTRVYFDRIASPLAPIVIASNDRALTGIWFDGQRYQRNASTPTLTQVYERSVVGRIVWFGLAYTIGVTKKEKEPNFEYDSGAGR